MPIHIASRRRFVRSLAAGSMAAVAGSVPADATGAGPDSETWALLADTHVAADPLTAARGIVMADNLRRTVAEVIARPQSPDAVIINGDCAYLKGLAGDYATFAKLVTPLMDAELTVAMTMGNHDDRNVFFDAFETYAQSQSPVAEKHVTVIEGRTVNWFLLDSLQIVNKVTGELGDQQLKWLAEALDARRDKPAVVVGHHNPQFELPADPKNSVSGLLDTKRMIAALSSRPWVQAYVFGHTHDWRLKKAPSGLQLINLPPVAYLFNPDRPAGWVEATTDSTGLTLLLHASDNQHPEHGKPIQIAWQMA